MTLLRRSATYVAPTITAGKPVGLAVNAVTEGEFGTFRIEVGNVWDCTYTVTTHELPTVETAGTNYTTFRDAPAILEGVGFAEPYGETVASIVIPAATEFDDLSTLFPRYANVDIWRVLPAAEAATYGDHSALGYPTGCAPYWHGFLVSVEVSTALAGVTLQAAGALAGEASYRAHQPVMVEEATAPDIGTAIARQLYPADYGRPLSPWRFYFEADTTDILSRHRGSRGQMVIDYLDEMLTLAQTTTTSWTISRAYDAGDYPQARKYYLRERGIAASGGVQENWITLGGYGIDVSLSRGDDDSPNVIYGEGIANDGSRWRNAKYPMLTPAAPTAPDRITGSDYPITLGDVDADFTAEVITQLQYQLRAAAYPDVEITGIFDADTVTAVEAYQTAMGLTVDGEIGSSGEWADVWDTSATDDELGSGYFQPIALDRRAEFWTYAPNGAVTGTNDTGGTAYDGRLRIERVISFGDKISKSRASTYAKRLVNASSADLWIGEIKLTADPEERSRLLIREGSTISIDGGVEFEDFYISGVQHAPEAGKFPTTLTVSNQPLDLLDLSTRIERNREARENPAKSFYSQRMRPTRPFRDAVGWDKESGAGIVQPVAVTGDTWNVIRIVGAQRGTVAAIKARTSASACKFGLALFGTEVTAANLNTLIANPLADETDGYGWWSHPDNIDTLEDYRFIEAWGEFENAAGYYPGSENQDPAATLTGKLIDSLSWQFVSDDPPFLWLAVYPDASCTFEATMRIVIEE